MNVLTKWGVQSTCCVLSQNQSCLVSLHFCMSAKEIVHHFAFEIKEEGHGLNRKRKVHYRPVENITRQKQNDAFFKRAIKGTEDKSVYTKPIRLRLLTGVSLACTWIASCPWHFAFWMHSEASSVNDNTLRCLRREKPQEIAFAEASKLPRRRVAIWWEADIILVQTRGDSVLNLFAQDQQTGGQLRDEKNWTNCEVRKTTVPAKTTLRTRTGTIHKATAKTKLRHRNQRSRNFCHKDIEKVSLISQWLQQARGSLTSASLLPCRKRLREWRLNFQTTPHWNQK